ncbi:MAG: DedA family protein, partial [Candidatus Thermochlorobacter sp.]
MLEELIAYVKTLDSTTIYLFLFAIAYLENVIPPIPGDMPVVFVGTLVALSDLSFVACVLWASV